MWIRKRFHKKGNSRRHNPVARNLRTPMYRKRIVTSKRIYNRKKEKKKNEIHISRD